MKVIIAGSRSITDYQLLEKVVENSGWGHQIAEVVSGCAYGVDSLGEMWAVNHHIPIKRFPADWKTHGKRAGYLRNVEMAAYGDALIAIWTGDSHGTKHMIDTMIRKKKSVYIHIDK